MQVILLFTVVASLVSAAPNKRACNRPPGGAVLTSAPDASPANATSSLKAIVAFGPGRLRSTHRIPHHSATGRVTSSSAVGAAPTDSPASDGSTTASPVAADAKITSSVQRGSSTLAKPTSTGGTNGAGLAINSESVNSFAGFLDGKLGWYTGWSTSPLAGTGTLEFVPQVWGEGNVASLATAAKSWTGVKFVLSFNEPDMSASVGGTAMSPQLAATKHKEWTKALGGSYQVGAPAVARGSKKWLQDWLTACGGGCEFSFVPFHFYGTNANDLIEYAKDFHTTFGKPLWVTEWACMDFSNGKVCNDAEVKAFMKTAITWFRGDGSSIVHRWAYFGAFPKMASSEGNANGLENADGSINVLGKYYISL